LFNEAQKGILTVVLAVAVAFWVNVDVVVVVIRGILAEMHEQACEICADASARNGSGVRIARF